MSEIIEDVDEQMNYDNCYEEEDEDRNDKEEDETILKERKEKFLSLLRLNTEESLRGIEIYGNIMTRSIIEPVYREGVHVGTSFSVEEIRIDDEIKAQLKEMGI